MSLKSILFKPIFRFRINYNIFKPWRWNWQKIKEFLKIFLLVVFLIVGFLSMYYLNRLVNGDSEENMSIADIGDEILHYLYDSGVVPEMEDKSNCNVAGIELHGSLVTYVPANLYDAEGNITEDMVGAENIVGAINRAEKDDKIKAIILEVDSYGGEPVAGEEVSNAIKYAKKPTVAIVRTAGASAAYLAASGAQKIFASKYSDIGGIGVTSSYLDNVKKNQAEGLSYVNLSAGKFKDTGSPDKALSREEKDLIMRDINIAHQNFIKMVAANRKLDIKKAAKLADGSTMLGEAALKNGLIDQVGNLYDVKQYLKTKVGADVEICW